MLSAVSFLHAPCQARGPREGCRGGRGCAHWMVGGGLRYLRAGATLIALPGLCTGRRLPAPGRQSGQSTGWGAAITCAPATMPRRRACLARPWAAAAVPALLHICVSPPDPLAAARAPRQQEAPIWHRTPAGCWGPATNARPRSGLQGARSLLFSAHPLPIQTQRALTIHCPPAPRRSPPTLI